MPGQVRVYRFTTQYLKPSTYRLTVSCDDDEGNQYFSSTTDVFSSSRNLEDVARDLVGGAIRMFGE